MRRIGYFVLIFTATIVLKNAYAITDEEKEAFQKFLMPLATQCAKELEINEPAIDENMNEERDPCIMACILEKRGALRDELIDMDAVGQEIKKYLHDEDEIEKMTIIIQDCAVKANESDLRDGNKGCERAGAFISCLKKNKVVPSIAS